MMITNNYLKSILEYNPETGDWTWLINGKNQHVKIGKKAGSNHGGYWRINIDGRHYLAHILAWFYMTEKWPEKEIDHKNNIGNDNRWENLRLATQSQNSGNQKIAKNNTSGYKGVVWHKHTKKWQVRIKDYNLGYFDDSVEAAKVYDRKAIEIYGEYAKTNFSMGVFA